MTINFKIKRKKWILKVIDKDDERLFLGGEPCIAQLFKQSRTIYMRDDLLEDEIEFKETLIHELTHAWIMTHAIDIKQFRDEEFICEFMGVYGEDIITTANEIIEQFQ